MQNQEAKVPLCQVQTVPDKIAEYIAGFCDGDGCIQMNENIIIISFSQSGNLKESPRILQFIQEWFGGSLCLSNHYKKHETWKPSYKLSIGDKSQVTRMLPLLRDKCVLKHLQAKVALDYCNAFQYQIGIGYPEGHLALKIETKKLLTSMKKLEAYQSIAIDSNKITNAWLSGFFDAEGCVGFASLGVKVRIGQKQSKLLLETIKNVKKFGGVTGHEYGVYGQKSVRLMKDILPYSIVKKQQMELALRILELQAEVPKKMKMQPEYRHEILILSLAIAELKHI
jgi:intein/homing endonuclease